MRHRIHKFDFESDSEDEFLAKGPVKRDERIRETYLYDFSMRLLVDTPECDIHRLNILNSALTTVLSHALFKHQEWTPVTHGLYHVINEEMRPITLKWMTIQDRRVCEARVRVSGRFVDLDAQLGGPKSMHEKISYNGCVHKSSVILEYGATLFLSSVYCAANAPDSTVFPGHAFHATEVPEPRDDGINNLYGIFEAHRAKNRTTFNHDLAWATVHDYLTKKTEERLEEMVREFGGLD